MLGIAQKLFAERSSKSSGEYAKKHQRWPFLEKMLVAKCLGYVDLSLANQLLKNDEEECVAALVCHLSQAARRGHICVKVNENVIPSPSEIWIVDDLEEEVFHLSSSDFDHLNSLILQGAKKIGIPLIYDVAMGEHIVNAPIYKNEFCYYLQRYWHLETVFLTGLLQHLDYPLTYPTHLIEIKKQVEVLINNEILLSEQAEAILKASQTPLTLITGGPGTGKTYTAGILLRILWECIQAENRENFKVVLAAPTGKAAANLEASIQRSLALVEGFPAIKAQTLHQLLGIRKSGGIQKAVQLDADLILVDESSMIDIHLMGVLVSGLKPGARLILLGDKHQLPSVEAGSLFADLTDYFLSDLVKRGQVVELKTCLRAELKSIIDLAGHIKNGDAASALKLLDGNNEGISLIETEEKCSGKELQKHLLKYVVPHFPIITKFPEDPLDLLKQFSHFRVLTPMRKGLLGVDALNAAIFQAMSLKMTSSACFIVPIMVMHNDYRRGLFNGEVGLLIREHECEYALFASREIEKSVRKIPILLMPRFEYAYCLSVHKSQGSEFDHVVLLLPDGTQNFGREALYTGVTRAKRCLEIWSSPRVFTQMVNQVDLRQSGVIDRLST